MDQDEAVALLGLLSTQAALAEKGWHAVIDDWQAMVVGCALGRKVSEPPLQTGPVTTHGDFAKAAEIRWRRLCTQLGVDPDTPEGVLQAMEKLGVVTQKRGVVAKRWALVDPVPDADTSPHLDREAQAAARIARHRHQVLMGVGDLLERGDGRYLAPSRGALAAALRTDEDTLADLADVWMHTWVLIDQPDGEVLLRQVEDADLDEALDALDDLPDSAFGPD